MTSGKQLAREIFRDTLAALDIPRVMQLKLSLAGSTLILDDAAIDLSACSSMFVVAIGKAAHAMAAGLRSFSRTPTSLRESWRLPQNRNRPFPA